MSNMIYIGTSGFSYDDWKGYFYPQDTEKKEMLDYYSRRFPCVEVNSTYYAIPSPFTFTAMVRKTPPDFRFVVKAHKDMTHTDDPVAETFDAFRRAIEPLREQSKFGCVLAQFPWSFRNRPENHNRLQSFKDLMGELPVIIEFRNAEWVADETFDLLRRLDLGFCCVDEPGLKGLMPRIAVATSRTGYVRFHGRNAKDWWKHEEAWQRYDYLYAEEELQEWVPRVKGLAENTETTYLFFNNHYRGKSAQNARMFARMLDLPLPTEESLQSGGSLGL